MSGRRAAPRRTLRSSLSGLVPAAFADGFTLGAAVMVLGRLLIFISSRRAGSARVG